MSYFTKNDGVTFLHLPSEAYRSCDSIECVVRANISDVDNKEMLFVQKSYVELDDERYPSFISFNAKIFTSFPNDSEKGNFELIEEIIASDAWVRIYKYKGNQE